jgi:hypothetical protein
VSIAEEGLREQVDSLREQSERARLNLETDLMYKLRDRWESPQLRNYRMRSFTFVKENFFGEDEIFEVQHLDPATVAILNFFEEVGYLTRIEVLGVERVWHGYSVVILMAWPLWEPAVKKWREQEDPLAFEYFEHLYRQIVDFDRQRGSRGEPPTKEELRRWVEVQQRRAAADDEDPMNKR